MGIQKIGIKVSGKKPIVNHDLPTINREEASALRDAGFRFVGVSLYEHGTAHPDARYGYWPPIGPVRITKKEG